MVHLAMTVELLKALQPVVQRVRTDVTAIKANGRQAWTNEPLTPDRLAKHLNGGSARGVCPIKAGESTTMVGLLDLDSHKGEVSWDDMAQVADQVLGALLMDGMVATPWRSSGGNGIHLIVLWDEPQDAYSVRCALTEAIGACGYSNGAGGVSKQQIEVFPKQDSVPVGGYGNQFVLPLAGKSEPLIPALGYEPGGRDAAVGMQWPTSVPVAKRERPVRSSSDAASGDTPRLRAALAAIPNEGDKELDYDAWRNIIFAIHHATDGAGLDLAHEFSARSGKYDPVFLDERVWPYIEAGKGVTEASIFAKAREAGWVEDIDAEFEAQPAPDKAERKGVPEAMHLTTDQANAGRIVRQFGKRLIVMAGQWFAWTGKRWEKDDGEVYRCGCTLSKLIHAEADDWRAKKTTDEGEMKINLAVAEALKKWAARSEMKASIEAALGLAKKLLAVPDDALDRNPWLLNCANGTVDLRTGDIKRHDPADFITKLVPLAYDPTARSAAWDTVMARVTLEEGMTTRPLARFLQRWFGYCATGSTREQAFVVHYGQGSNGKSTILDTVADVLGDYAATAAPGLMVGNAKDRHPTEVADLHGRRMVTSHETGEGGQLKEDVVKQLTGSDKVKARFMRADFFEFDPTHKLQLLTNHKPAIKGQDNGIWRRVLLMPYLARFAVAEEVAAGRAHFVRDTKIMDRLATEKQGVLTWVVEGAKAWAQDGLQPPDAVLAASRDYQTEQDRVGQFVADCCEMDPTAREPLAGGFGDGLYGAYKEWATGNGIFHLSKQKFAEELKRAIPGGNVIEGREPETRRKVRWVVGVRLLVA